MTPERRAEIEALALPLHPDVTGAAGRYGIARLSSYGQASIIHELLAEVDRLTPNPEWRAKHNGWSESDIREEVESWRKQLNDLNGNWPILTPSQLCWLLDTIDGLLNEVTTTPTHGASESGS